MSRLGQKNLYFVSYFRFDQFHGQETFWSIFDISKSFEAESHCDAASERERDESSTLNKRIEFFSGNTDWLLEEECCTTF